MLFFNGYIRVRIASEALRAYNDPSSSAGRQQAGRATARRERLSAISADGDSHYSQMNAAHSPSRPLFRPLLSHALPRREGRESCDEIFTGPNNTCRSQQDSGYSSQPCGATIGHGRRRSAKRVDQGRTVICSLSTRNVQPFLLRSSAHTWPGG